MPDSSTRMHTPQRKCLVVCVPSWTHGLHGWAQETRFQSVCAFWIGHLPRQPHAGFGLHGGITSVSTSGLIVNADQPAAAAALLEPHFPRLHPPATHGVVSEGQQTTNALTGGPGNFGLVVKQPRSLKRTAIGIDADDLQIVWRERTVTDTTLGDIARVLRRLWRLGGAYLGLAHGWRGRTWLKAGRRQRVDHGSWFGRRIPGGPLVWRRRPNVRLDIQDITFRDVRNVVSSRHRSTGWVLGAEAFHVLRARYDEFKQFRGSWTLRLGATWSPHGP